MTVTSIWPDAWKATLKHAYANPKSLFARRLTFEEGGPAPGQYGENEQAFLEKVLRDENALNDVLNVTMALMPDGFHQRLADYFAPGSFDATAAIDVTHDYRARYYFDEISRSDVTQPDHLHAGMYGLMGIELKVRSKSSVKQLLHYALLAAREEMRHPYEGKHLTLLLTPYADLAEATYEKISDRVQARKAMLAAIPDYLTNHRRMFVTEKHLHDVTERMTVAHVSFGDFVKIMECEVIGSTGPAASTLTKLIDGASTEFKRHAVIAKRAF